MKCLLLVPDRISLRREKNTKKCYLCTHSEHSLSFFFLVPISFFYFTFVACFRVHKLMLVL